MNAPQLRFPAKLLLVVVLLAGAGLALEQTGHAATFWSFTGQMPPLPYHPFPELATEEIGSGEFMYDDTGVDYDALWADSVETAPRAPTSSLTMTSAEEFGCALWLEICPPTNSAGW